MNPNALRLRWTAALASLLIAGCTSITGLGGGSSYACKAPDGVKCDSVSGTYHNAIHNNLPSQRQTPAVPSGEKSDAPPRAGTARLTPATYSGPSVEARNVVPLRAAPKILRLWIKPWEDSDRDLNGESVVYVQIDDGRWLVEHAQRQAREAFAPVRPGKALDKSAAAPAATGSTADNSGAVAQTLRQLQARVPTPSDD